MQGSDVGGAQECAGRDLSGVRIPLNRILIAVWVRPAKRGGIIIPDTAQDIKGKQRMEVALSNIEGISPGDIVVFNKYHGSTIEIEGREYLFLEEAQILGVL